MFQAKILFAVHIYTTNGNSEELCACWRVSLCGVACIAGAVELEPTSQVADKSKIVARPSVVVADQ